MFDITTIKSKISCYEYAQRMGIAPQKPGDRTYSPFHASKNPTSFIVYDDSWFSFSDGIGGDVIDLAAQLHHNGDKGKAIRELAELTGVRADYDTDGYREYMDRLSADIHRWHSALTSDDRTYMHSRGINDATIDDLLIGRNADGRLVIPYYKNGNPVYYVSRAMPGCRYPESKYRKMKIDDYNDHCPWGLQSLTRNCNTLIIPEGSFDAMSFYQCGYPVLCAITGRFSRQQMPTVLNACHSFEKVIITYDNDLTTHAGESFTMDMAKTLTRNGINFYVATTPQPFHDISEYYAHGGDLDSLVKSAVPGNEYICSTFTDIAELQKYILSVSRYRTTAEVTAMLRNIQFDAETKKELIKLSKSAPNEVTIADEIRKAHQLIYILNDAFYEWNGKVWERIDDLTVQSYARNQYGKQFATYQRIANITRLLRSECYTDIQFNAKSVISFVNGTLDLPTGTFREHMPNDYCSIMLPYEYHADAVPHRWLKFIEEVTAENPVRAEALQMIAGYVLFPDCRFQKIFALMGGGANGKSVYLDTLQSVFDSRNCTHIDPANLSNEFWCIHLKNSLLNFATEIDTDFSKAEKMLKTISDGETIQACYKGQNHITFKPRAKLIFACNSTPETRTLAGMDRRMYFIDFPMRFVDTPSAANELPRDTNLTATLLTELPGIFNWCYDGYQLLTTVGYFTDTDEQTAFMTDFQTASNPIKLFFDEKWETLKSTTITRAELYYRYQQWCIDNGYMAFNIGNFLRKFREIAQPYIEFEGRRRINGVLQYLIKFNEKTIGSEWNTWDTFEEDLDNFIESFHH